MFYAKDKIKKRAVYARFLLLSKLDCTLNFARPQTPGANI